MLVDVINKDVYKRRTRGALESSKFVVSSASQSRPLFIAVEHPLTTNCFTNTNPSKMSSNQHLVYSQSINSHFSPLYIPDEYTSEEFQNFIFLNNNNIHHQNSSGNHLPKFQSIVNDNVGFYYGNDGEDTDNLTEGEMSKLLRFTQQFAHENDGYSEIENDKEGLKAIVKKVLYNHLQNKCIQPTSASRAVANSIGNYLNVKQQPEGIPNREGYQLITPPLSPKDEWQQQQQQHQQMLPSAPNLLAAEPSAYHHQGTLNRGKHFDNGAVQACQYQQPQQVNNLNKMQSKAEFARLLDNVQIESGLFILKSYCSSHLIVFFLAYH